MQPRRPLIFTKYFIIKKLEKICVKSKENTTSIQLFRILKHLDIHLWCDKSYHSNFLLKVSVYIYLY